MVMMFMLANELIESLRISLGKEQKFSDRSWAFMVLFDKIQVMQGNPTAIRETLSRGMNREQREERMEALMRSAEERRQQMKLVAGQVKDVTNDG
jgi:hypothetical protein